MKYCYDNECFNLAIYFFGEKDSRLQEIAQAIQDTVEQFPDTRDIDATTPHLLAGESSQPRATCPACHGQGCEAHENDNGTLTSGPGCERCGGSGTIAPPSASDREAKP